MRIDTFEAFHKVMFDSKFRYRGYSAFKRPDGTLLVLNRVMTIQEFIEWVDGIYLSIHQSIEKSIHHSL